ncbi:MAG: hypothetical protein M1391_11535 [Bacteroidetes bacterium]|nr:hypothetical protein [Bacteroidota bacterium]
MRLIVFISIVFLAAGCTNMLLKPADFSWPAETVLKVDDKGVVSEERYNFDFNVKPVFYEEFKDSNTVAGKEIRMIRDRAGHYYLTGENFKNVYLFMPVEGGMKLEDKIELPDTLTLKAPVFNQKPTNVELIDGTNKFVVTGNEIARAK